MRRFGLPLAEIAEPVDGPWAQRLRKIAEHHQLVIVAGMFTPSGDGRVKNTLRAVGPDVDAHYDKVHLFDAFGFRESDTVAAGAEPVMITVGDAKVGLTTCYDVQVSRPVSQARRAGRAGDLRGGVLGSGRRQGRAMAAAHPSSRPGQHLVCDRCRSGRSSSRWTRIEHRRCRQCTNRSRLQRGRLAQRRGVGVARGGTRPARC